MFCYVYDIPKPDRYIFPLFFQCGNTASNLLSIVFSVFSKCIINKVFSLKIFWLLVFASWVITATRWKKILINISINGMTIPGKKEKSLTFYNIYIIKNFISNFCSFLGICFARLPLFFFYLLTFVYICNNKFSK